MDDGLSEGVPGKMVHRNTICFEHALQFLRQSYVVMYSDGSLRFFMPLVVLVGVTPSVFFIGMVIILMWSFTRVVSSSVLASEGDSTVYRTHIIKDGPAERQKCQQSANKCVGELQHRLDATFPDGGMLDAFTVLDPSG